MYSTEVNGDVLEFGTSGLLYQSNKLMYDRSTNSLWRQFLGEPVVGELVDSGIKLKILPSVVTTWADWVTAHPDTTVIDIDTGVYPPSFYYPEEDSKSIYYNYRQSPEVMFPVWQQSNLLPAKAQVLGLNINGQARAYPLKRLREESLINDSLGGENLVVVTVAAGAARAYQRGNNLFSLAQPGTGEEGAMMTQMDEQGRRWNVEEEALVREDDPTQRLPRLESRIAYWLGWYSSFPATDVYGVAESNP